MNIMLPLHKMWIDKILSGEKPIEFRTKLPKNLQPNTTIYLYETSKFGGIQRVIGECKVDYIIDVLNEDGKWPMYGAYPFIDFYYENVKKDKKIAQRYKKLKEEFKNHPKYRYGFILGYAFSPRELNSLREDKTLIDISSIKGDFRLIDEIVNDNIESEKYIDECDNWLRNIGFYDETDESHYKYGIVLKDVVRYTEPLEINHFVDKSGNAVKAAPQLWIYCNRKG